ncbi:MAG: phasin family protein [Xanthobacteraceae bacterium]
MSQTSGRKTLPPKPAVQFDPASFQLPVIELAAFNEMTEKSSAQAREGYREVKALAGQAANVLKDTCSIAVQRATDYNRLVTEFSHANIRASFDYAVAISAAKSPSEVIELSTAHAHKQFEAVVEQAKDLAALVQKTTAELAEPITKALNKVA